MYLGSVSKSEFSNSGVYRTTVEDLPRTHETLGSVPGAKEKIKTGRKWVQMGPGKRYRDQPELLNETQTKTVELGALPVTPAVQQGSPEPPSAAGTSRGGPPDGKGGMGSRYQYHSAPELSWVLWVSSYLAL